MILVDPEGKEYPHAVHLSFYAFEDHMNYEALLAGLVASAGRCIKDLHVFVGSKILVNQMEGSRIPRTEGAKRTGIHLARAPEPGSINGCQDKTLCGSSGQTPRKNKEFVKEVNIRKIESHLGR
ncbi:hypothetical protein Tco_0921727 [Tanacetum coccineum]